MQLPLRWPSGLFLRPLPILQNNIDRLLYRCSEFIHITSILRDVHWLFIKLRSHFKILVPFIQNSSLSFSLSPFFYRHVATTTPLFACSPHLVHSSFFCMGDRGFSPKLWNKLFSNIRLSSDSFKSFLKTRFHSITFS